jgi:hypothetical protein
VPPEEIFAAHGLAVQHLVLDVFRQIVADEMPHLLAELLLVGREGEFHGSILLAPIPLI